MLVIVGALKTPGTIQRGSCGPRVWDLLNHITLAPEPLGLGWRKWVGKVRGEEMGFTWHEARGEETQGGTQ